MTASTLPDAPTAEPVRAPGKTDAKQLCREILENPEIRRRAYALTVEQYHKLVTSGLMGVKAELLEGFVIEKMSKSPLHSAVVQKLARKLRKAISDKLDIRQELPMTCVSSEPEPDFSVVQARSDDYEGGHPTTAELVIEIAITSAEIDRRKAAIYAAAGVREYWIVLPETRQIERHTNPSDAQYTMRQIFAASQTVKSEVLPAFEVNLDEMLPR